MSAVPFQSAPPHGGRRARARPRSGGIGSFNPRPRTGGDWLTWSRGAATRGFNPRPRTGGDCGELCGELCVHVSIRAPARGATPPLEKEIQADIVFQSAPPHGGRLVTLNLDLSRLTFQSAPPHGGRQAVEAYPTTRSRFNPRPRTGGDAVRSSSTGGCTMFQSAPPHGGRLCAARPDDAKLDVSIRAPARGATYIQPIVDVSRVVFQSAPPHGGRPRMEKGLEFQSAPPHGGRDIVDEFQSAPPHGGRLCFLNHHVVVLGSFNPRPRTGGDPRFRPSGCM